mgnify:CR=1 FL=1
MDDKKNDLNNLFSDLYGSNKSTNEKQKQNIVNQENNVDNKSVDKKRMFIILDILMILLFLVIIKNL